MAPAIAETRQATLAAILLVDRQGVVLGGRDAGSSLAGLPELRRALAGQANTALRFNDGYRWRYPLRWVSRATDIRLHHARPIRAGQRIVGAVLVSRSPRALFRGMWEDRFGIAAGTATIFLLLVLLTAIFARAFVRPIEKLSEASRALAGGRQAMPRRPTLQVVEIRRLYDDFEFMAAAIARRSRYLRDFAAALSHEFKTPLAGIRGGIELLEDHGATMSEAERTRFLANMSADADRLSRLVSRLMELARADMQVADPAARADLAALLARLADAFSSDGFTVALDLPASLPPVAMDGAALETVLETLVDNARGAGAARLAVTARREDGTLLLDLADDGPGVPEGDRERVFDPFFTSKRESGGTGLGLPIARALIAGSKGWLELAESERGARFVLRLPLAG
jgi:signal transduction histidine kinase